MGEEAQRREGRGGAGGGDGVKRRWEALNGRDMFFSRNS